MPNVSRTPLCSYLPTSTVSAESHYTASISAAAVGDRSMSYTNAHPSVPVVTSSTPSHAGANTKAVLNPRRSALSAPRSPSPSTRRR
eukprot:IDg15110t1